MDRPFTTYVTAGTLLSELQTTEGRAIAVARLRENGFYRAVLESYRGGLVVDEALLRDVRDFFVRQGFDTLGGLMPVWGAGFGKPGQGIEVRGPFFCYSAHETVAALDAEIRKLARLFDQVVVDDGFLTACRCPLCQAGRGKRDWFSFRRDLLCTVARRWVAAARDENPKVRVTVKFPQYYDRYHRFGYDAERFPKIFDAVWVGTETRDPDTLDYGHVEPYQGYFNTRWMRACAGAKFECGWFDYLDCDEQLFYEQAVTTSLGTPQDITIFCYGREVFSGGKMARLVQAVPMLTRLRDIATVPRGVHVLKPPNSDGREDLFLFDYLGMLGVPCVPVTRLEPAMRSVFVPAHGMSDPDTPKLIADILGSGGTVAITFNALEQMLSAPDFLDLFGYDGSGVVSAVVRPEWFQLGGERLTSKCPVRLAGDLAPSDAAVLVSAGLEGCERGILTIPVATVKTHPSGGKALVWNLGTFGHNAFQVNEQLNVPVATHWFSLPKPVLDALRSTLTEPLGFHIAVPPRVACFLFARHLVAVNYTSNFCEVRTKGLRLSAGNLLTDSGNTTCAGNDLFLAPRCFAAVECVAPF
jgi:hypothetical protein